MKLLKELNEARHQLADNSKTARKLHKAIKKAFKGNCGDRSDPVSIRRWNEIMQQMPTFDIDDLLMHDVSHEQYIDALNRFTSIKLEALR